MARKARQRISYGRHTQCCYTQKSPTRSEHGLIPWFRIVLPLARSSEGHRLGVNGLAVDTDQPILSVLSHYPWCKFTLISSSDIQVAGMESSAPGILTLTCRKADRKPRISYYPLTTRAREKMDRTKACLPFGVRFKLTLTGSTILSLLGAIQHLSRHLQTLPSKSGGHTLKTEGYPALLDSTMTTLNV